MWTQDGVPRVLSSPLLPVNLHAPTRAVRRRACLPHVSGSGSGDLHCPDQSCHAGEQTDYHPASFRLTLGEYQVVALIGSGGQSTVYRVWSDRFNQMFVAKVMAGKSVTPFTHPELLAMRTLLHPAILKCYDAFVAAEQFVMIYELCEGGTLQDLLDEMRKGEGLPYDRFREIAADLVGALAFVHARGLAHGDVKTRNVLFADAARRHVKLGDFGLSSKARRGHWSQGTPAYMAPELWMNQETDAQAADVWALGVCLYVMATGKLPWSGETEAEMAYHLIRCEYEIGSPWPDLQAALGRMLVPQERRATMAKLASLPVFAARVRGPETYEPPQRALPTPAPLSPPRLLPGLFREDPGRVVPSHSRGALPRPRQTRRSASITHAAPDLRTHPANVHEAAAVFASATAAAFR